jgi:hypothetical protein
VNCKCQWPWREELQQAVRETLYSQPNDPLIIEAEAIATDNDLETPGNDAAKRS